MYKCVTVIVSVYGYIDKQTDGIDRHGDRHKDRHKDREQRVGTEKYILLAYYLEFVGLSVGCFGWFVSLWFTLVRFTLVRFGCLIDWFRFLSSHKKIF